MEGLAAAVKPPVKRILSYVFPDPAKGLPGLPLPYDIRPPALPADLCDVLSRVFENSLIKIHMIQTALDEWKPKEVGENVRAFPPEEPTTFESIDPLASVIAAKYSRDPEDLEKIRLLMKVRYLLAVFISKIFMAANDFNPQMDDPRATLCLAVDKAFQNMRNSLQLITGKEIQVPEARLDPGLDNSVLKISAGKYYLDIFIEDLVPMVQKQKPRTRKPYIMWYGIGVLTISPFLFSWLYKSGTCGYYLEWISTFVEKRVKTVKEYLLTLREDKNNTQAALSIERESFRRMLIDFLEPSIGEKLENKSVLEMMELAARRYEKLLESPMKNPVSFAQGSFIQVQAFKVLVESGISLAYTFFEFALMSLTLFCLVGAAYVRSKRGRKYKLGRTAAKCCLREADARIKQLILVTKEEREGQGEGFSYLNGLALYSLDTFYRKVRVYAIEKQEWDWVCHYICTLRDCFDQGEAKVAKYISYIDNMGCLKI